MSAVEIRPSENGHVVRIDGVDIAGTVASLTVEASHKGATVTLVLSDVQLLIEEPDARIRLRDDTVAALQALGWTPPAEQAGEQP